MISLQQLWAQKSHHRAMADLETPMCDVPGMKSPLGTHQGPAVRVLAVYHDEERANQGEEEALVPSTKLASKRNYLQAGVLALLAGALLLAFAHGQGLLSFNISSANEKAAVSGASGAKHVGDTKDVVKEKDENDKKNEKDEKNQKDEKDEKEATCHNAVPGEACYGAVNWHKWIGLIETPQNYGGNLTRESDRHNIQSWLYQNGKNGCAKPCKESIRYPVPSAPQPPGARLYCFSVARTGPEMDSMFMQRQTGTGIFACNGHDVYSDHEIDIDGYKTKLIPSTAAGVSVDQTAANSQVFMKTWMALLSSNFWYQYDFLAKVDPDAILFPERLRGHVQAHVGQNVFFLNCAVHVPAMYGAVEVFSKSSLGAYQASHGRCEQSLPFWQWGEDRYMQECLKMLGVVPIGDYTENVRDARCWGSDCGNKGAVAFHPFKTVNGWYRCHLASQ